MNRVEKFIYHVRLPNYYQQWNLYLIGDIHFGSKACDVDQLKKDVAEVAADDFGYVFLVGDNFEAIAPDDIRYEMDLHDWSKDYSKNIVKDLGNILDPIKKKVIAGITGNHEDKFEKRHYADLSSMLYDRLEVPYMGYCCIFPIKVQAPCDRAKKRVGESKDGWETKYTLDFFGHHGTGGGRLPGSKINRLTQVQMGFDADIYFMGHVHDQISYLSSKIGCRDSGGMYEKPKAFVVGATYYKSYMAGSTTYAEKMMFNPSRLGMTKLSIKLQNIRKDAPRVIMEL